MEPPSRNGVTYRVAATDRGAVVVGEPSLTGRDHSQPLADGRSPRYRRAMRTPR